MSSTCTSLSTEATKSSGNTKVVKPKDGTYAFAWTEYTEFESKMKSSKRSDKFEVLEKIRFAKQLSRANAGVDYLDGNDTLLDQDKETLKEVTTLVYPCTLSHVWTWISLWRLEWRKPEDHGNTYSSLS